jgi:hypothetical protein
VELAAAEHANASRRHADALSASRYSLTPEQQAELISEAEHWLASLRGRAGQARVFLDIGSKGLTITGGAGK